MVWREDVEERKKWNGETPHKVLVAVENIPILRGSRYQGKYEAWTWSCRVGEKQVQEQR